MPASAIKARAHQEYAKENLVDYLSLQEMTEATIRQLPALCRFGEEDARLLGRHRGLLEGLEDELVRDFYDTVFAHAPTRAVFQPEERAAREAMLRQWWRRTLTGPFDGHYWAWQALVGLAHVKRGVKNAMMIGMWGWTVAWIGRRLEGALDEVEARRLLSSFKRLATTVQALTAESYLEHYVRALQRATGFKPGLLERLASAEIDQMLAEARAAWREGA